MDPLPARSSRGADRPEASAAAGYIAAADIGGTRLRMLLADGAGTPVARWNMRLSAGDKDPAAVVNLLRAGFDSMMATLPPAPLLHLTAGAPGMTDLERGTVLAAPNLPGWTDVPLRALLESSFGAPAVVENDTNLAALGEYRAGAAQGVDDFVFVALGTGVGAGIVLGGKLHRGRNGSAGEIGYLPMAGAPRKPLRQSDMGQLEASLGGLGIEARWRDVLQGSDRVDPALQSLHAPEILDRAELGDPLAADVLQWVARLLADALATVALLLDPALFVLGGGVGSHGCLALATAAVLCESDFPMPEIRTSALGTEAQLFGGLAVSLAALDAARRC